MLLLSALLPATRRKAGGGLAAALAVKGTGRTCWLLPMNETNRVRSQPGFSQDVPTSGAAVCPLRCCQRAALTLGFALSLPVDLVAPLLCPRPPSQPPSL